MAVGGSKIGDAFVDIHGNPVPLEQDLKKAKGAVEKETATMGASVEKNLGGGFTKAGQKIEDATAGVRKFSGAISSSLGVVTAMVGGITLLVGGLKKMNDEWEENIRLKREARDTTARIRAETDLILGGLRGMTTEQQLELDLRIKSTAKAAEIRGLIRDGKLEAAEGYNINLDIQASLVLQYKEQLKLLEAQKEAAEWAKIEADEKVRSVLNTARLLEMNERMLIIQKEMAGENIPDLFGPFLEDFPEVEARIAGLGEKMAAAFQDAISGAQFEQDIAGPIEEVGKRIEAKLDALKFRGGL